MSGFIIDEMTNFSKEKFMKILNRERPKMSDWIEAYDKARKATDAALKQEGRA